jgi:acetyl-CoA carboxylase carboxyltransferase component
MPYFDEERPYVNSWFASSEGATCHAFCQTISERNQDRLEEEGGACIMYTHFGAVDFYEDGLLNAGFKRLMERLRRKDGWFVPVSTLLDHLEKERGRHVISASERNQLERKWLIHKVFDTRGTT